MFRSILVPLDGSALAEHVVRYAKVLAQKTSARLVLLRVVEEDRSEPSAGRAAEEARREASAELEDLTERMLRSVDVDPVVATGDPANAILAEAATRQVSLIAMSTHGRSGVGRWIYGSVADAVMRRAPVPVLLASPHVMFAWPRDRVPRVLLPLDGSNVSERAIPSAEDLAAALGAELVLTQVVEPAELGYANDAEWGMVDPTPFLEAARDYLEGIATGPRERGRTVEVAEVFGFTVSAIAGLVREREIDLIILSSHGSGGITRALLGSVATGLVQTATVPVVVVGPGVEVAIQAPTDGSASHSAPVDESPR